MSSLVYGLCSSKLPSISVIFTDRSLYMAVNCQQPSFIRLCCLKYQTNCELLWKHYFTSFPFLQVFRSRLNNHLLGCSFCDLLQCRWTDFCHYQCYLLKFWLQSRNLCWSTNLEMGCHHQRSHGTLCLHLRGMCSRVSMILRHPRRQERLPSDLPRQTCRKWLACALSSQSPTINKHSG